MMIIKRIMAMIAAVAMIISVFSPNAYANEINEYDESADYAEEGISDAGSELPAGADDSCFELLVGTDDPGIFSDEFGEVVSGYNGIYLVRFGSEEEMREGYDHYSQKADFVDENVEFCVSDSSSSDISEISRDDADEAGNSEDSLDKLGRLTGEAMPELPAGTIAVIDTGVNEDDLAGRISLIDDGEGYDDHGHGTAMYRFIKEEFPGAAVLSIKAMDKDGKGTAADIYAAIIYAVECGADFINLSISAFASQGSELIKDAVGFAASKGVTVTGAAGNNGRNAGYYIPGNIDDALIAGSCDESGRRRDISNYGETVDLYVVSDSTSEAAARLSGIIAGAYMTGKGIDIGSGKVFPAAYDEIEEDTDDVSDERQSLFSVALREKPAEGPYIVNKGTGTSFGPPHYHYFSFEDENGNPAVCIDNDSYGFDDETLDDFEELFCYIPMRKTELYAGHSGSDAERMVYYLTYYLITHNVNLEGTDYPIIKTHAGHYALSYWNMVYGGGEATNVNLPDSNGYDETQVRGWLSEAMSQENITECDKKDFHVYRYTYTGDAEGVQSFIGYEMYDMKKIRIKKVSEVTSFKTVTDVSPNYSLAGAVYEVRKDHENGEVVGRLVTDADGNTDELTVRQGIYYISEVTPSKGYKLDKTVHRIELGEDSAEVTAVTSVEEPDSVELLLTVFKKDSEGSRVDGADISGAEFTVSYFTGDAGHPYLNAEHLNGRRPDKVWRFKTDDQGRINFGEDNASGDGFFMSGGRRVIPFGTLLIEESKTPDDYSQDHAEYIYADSTGNRMMVSGRRMVIKYTPDGVFAEGKTVAKDMNVTVRNQVKRGDISISKTDRTDGSGMKGVRFTITNVVSREQVEIVTDENGYWSSASSYSPHTRDTNSRRPHTGTWFFGTSSKDAGEIDDSLGAFPIGIYEIMEVVPDGYYAGDIRPYRVEIKASDEGRTVNTVFTNDRLLKLSTRARDSVTMSSAAFAGKGAVLTDKIDYEDAVPGQSYTVFTRLIVKGTGEEIARAARSFKADGSSGTLDINIRCDLSELEGKDVVFFEYFYKGVADDMDGEPIGKHEDINDDGQTIHIPGISTTAVSSAGLKEELAGRDALITDSVKYSNLPAGRYRVEGRLVFADAGGENGSSHGSGDNGSGHGSGDNGSGHYSGENGDPSIIPVKDDEGNEIICDKVFENTDTEGSVELRFGLPGESLEGRTVVVFERLYNMNGNIIAVHEDINDADQTVRFPKLRTHASGVMAGYGKESSRCIHVAEASRDSSIIDFVEFENLTTGEEYKVRGRLRYEDGSPVTDEEGEEIIAEKMFSPEEENGEISVMFGFDGSGLAGKTVYISEELYLNGVLTGVHDDSSDTEQIIHFPAIRTHAKDDYSGIKTGEWREVVSLTDTVMYMNLVEGQRYRVRGTLIDRNTGEIYRDINGDPVTACSDIFIPGSPEGSVSVRFRFRTDLYNGQAEDDRKEVGTRSANDINTEDGAGRNDGKTLLPGDEKTGDDTCRNDGKILLPGDAKTGDDTSRNDEKTLIPGDAKTGDDTNVNGEKVTGNTEKDMTVRGLSLVVFEELVVVNGDEEGVVASHKDINDEGQTVYYPRRKDGEKVTERYYEKTVERFTEREKEMITERLIEKHIEKPDDYCRYLCYLEIMGLLDLDIMTDGAQTEGIYPTLAETDDKKEEVTEDAPTVIKPAADVQPRTGDKMPVLKHFLTLLASVMGIVTVRKLKNRNDN